MNLLEHLSRAINQWVERLLFGLGFAMAMIVAVQVFFRYVLNHSLFWSEELARYLLVWLTFLGASVAYYRGAHPGIDFFYVKMPPTIKQAARFLVHLASLILWKIWQVLSENSNFKLEKSLFFLRLQITPALHLPKWIIFSIIPISGLILMVHALTFLGREFKGPARGS